MAGRCGFAGGLWLSQPPSRRQGCLDLAPQRRHVAGEGRTVGGGRVAPAEREHPALVGECQRRVLF